jgi:hypothetical protein
MSAASVPVDRPVFALVQRAALIVGVVASLLSLVGAALDHEQFFRSYLVAYIFWSGMTLGSLALVLLVLLAGGLWGIAIRRVLEAAANTLPLVALLFVPLLLGVSDIYPWSRGDVSGPNQASYLNLSSWIARSAIYFALWLLISFLVQRWSRQQDVDADPEFLQRIRRPSALALIGFALALTFALVDWTMSLEPHWWSTIYPAMVGMGMALSAYGFAIVIAAFLAQQPPLAHVLSRKLFNDLGSLLLAFVMLWAYLSFSQFMVIYAGNLSEEVPWYVRRLQGGWEWIAAGMTLSQFALPFVLLLFRDLKRSALLLAIVAGVLVIGRWVDVFWLVSPGTGLGPRALSLHWLDLTTSIGMGGLWIAYFVWRLNRRPLLPLHDPRLLALATEERELVEA